MIVKYSTISVPPRCVTNKRATNLIQLISLVNKKVRLVNSPKEYFYFFNAFLAVFFAAFFFVVFFAVFLEADLAAA